MRWLLLTFQLNVVALNQNEKAAHIKTIQLVRNIQCPKLLLPFFHPPHMEFVAWVSTTACDFNCTVNCCELRHRIISCAWRIADFRHSDLAVLSRRRTTRKLLW